MGRILLVNPSYQNSYGDSIGSLVNPIFPVLSMATLAAVARANHHTVEVLDLSWKHYDTQDFTAKVQSFRPDIVGFTVLTPAMNQVKDMSIALKKISNRIISIAGGPHVSALPEVTLLESSIDAVVYGEGENTFRDIINGRKFSETPGLVFRDGSGGITTNTERAVIANLDDLPMPAWDVFDLELYARKTSRLFARKTPFVTAEFSRGCIYKCDFCASKLTMALGYRKKSPKRCAEEAAYMASLGIKEFMLADDIFTTDANWAKEVCREMVKRNNQVAWSCTNGIRVESSNQELFNLMRKAGCYRVAFGFESGNDEVLKNFGKGGKATLEKGLTAVKEAKQAKLETIGFFQIGLSSDTKETIDQTISYARKLDLHMFKFGVTIAFPGTKMFKDYRQKGLIRSYDWDHYHIYSGFDLFNHPQLSLAEIQDCVKRGYRLTTFRNPTFILRRFFRGLMNGDIFSDVIFFFRFVTSSYLRKKGTTKYEFHEEWPPCPLTHEACALRVREIS